MPRKTDSNNPADWLHIAAAEMDGLRVLAEREVSYNMCRGKLAEVLEKILKAELLRLGWHLEKTHDLRKLGGELAQRKSDLVPAIQPLTVALADAYFSERYPGFDLEDPDWPDLRQKLSEITALLATVKTRLVAK